MIDPIEVENLNKMESQHNNFNVNGYFKSKNANEKRLNDSRLNIKKSTLNDPNSKFKTK